MVSSGSNFTYLFNLEVHFALTVPCDVTSPIYDIYVIVLFILMEICSHKTVTSPFPIRQKLYNIETHIQT